MMCHCVSEPPVFDLPPPPDPSLIWHLISDETLDEAVDEQCGTSNQFVSISDIRDTISSMSDDVVVNDDDELIVNVLIGVAVVSILLLVAICATVARRVRQRHRDRATSSSSKKLSSDSMLVSREHLWTYNSMKPRQMVYTNDSTAGSRVFQHTPTTLRSYVGMAPPPPPPMRHSESTTLRLNPHENSAYHTISMVPPPPSDHYEEIGYLTTTTKRMASVRRPPPSCRPPQPPTTTTQSPASLSDASYDREISRIANESPRQWDDGSGRESGYGTAPPSHQWKSPTGGSASPYVTPQTMTYV
ncbi:unnamed protein product [Caenorhabditis bovis]|uniref:Uncharacterized protein n=1 Tax=Caenorhabditis bovis TaxID=2654633 RepID=A0A8S1EFP8_9PELO|nr:unnamed protein product [Caenorhabditis bovis]